MQAEELYFLLKPFCQMGEVRGRTTVQKIFYLLQSFGYPTRLEYFLHYYGPYSEDLTSFLMFAGNSGLLAHKRRPMGAGSLRFDYTVTDSARHLVRALEKEIMPRGEVQKARRFGDLAEELSRELTNVLALAATILYFEEDRGCSRQEARKKTRRLKKRMADRHSMRAADDLLRKIEQEAA